MASDAEITRLLATIDAGDQEVLDQLVPLVYEELRGLAHRCLGRRRPELLHTTALVNEAYLRLVDQRKSMWKNRAHFLGIAALAMRRVLINAIQERRCLKRGRSFKRLALEEAALVGEDSQLEMLAVNDSLETLASFDPRKSKLVELRYFGGLTMEEAASVLEVSLSTAKRDWNLAKAWIIRDLSEEQSSGS